MIYDRGAYIRDVPVEEIVEWFRSLMSEDPTLEQISEDTIATWGEHAQLVVSGMAPKPFLHVWFCSNESIWDSDLAIAKALFGRFQTEVRCGAGESGYPDDFWSLSIDGQVLVGWDADDA